MRAGKRWQAATIPETSPLHTWVDLLKQRLGATDERVDRPWDEDDERRWQKQFGQPSPLSHKAIPTN
jgi:hypothetical protein